jgi:hypothetical protein
MLSPEVHFIKTEFTALPLFMNAHAANGDFKLHTFSFTIRTEIIGSSSNTGFSNANILCKLLIQGTN